MSSATPAIHGSWDSRFRSVRDAFAEGFRDRNELGAAVTVTVGGRTVIDLWGGHADVARSRPWDRDTIVNLYSTTKGATALCALRLVEQGKLDLDAPVTRYWPEFGAAGKESLRVRWLLSHRAGLPAVRQPLPPEMLYDAAGVCAALAAEAPWWTPGSDFGYHPVTYGWLVGELVRRVSGRSLGSYLRDEISGPLGLDLHVGVPDAAIARCAEITMLAPPPEIAEAMASAGAEPSLPMLAFANPMGTGDHNTRAYRTAEIPAINGHATARALAQLYGVLAAGGSLHGVHLLAPDTVLLARSEQSKGVDRVLGLPLRIGHGFWLGQPERPGLAFGPSPGAFGHPGAGGSLGFADPESGVGFGYVMNRTGGDLTIDPRPQALIDATYEALASDRHG